MRGTVACAALSCALGLASAKALKWSDNGPRWIPARETFGYMPFLGMEAPGPTPAPQVVKPRKDLERRDSTDNTCAFIEGLTESPLWCAQTAHCVYNSINSHIGCCDDGKTSCPIFTKCYDSTDHASYSTNNGYTLWCGNSTYPHCITHLYQDDTPFKSYTVLGCAVAAGTGRIWRVPLTTSTSTRSTSTSTSTSTTSTSTTSSSTSSSAPDPVFSSTSTTGPTDSPSPQPSSSTPVGPIVGGVVGGLAAIALIILGIWALMRQNDKQKKKAAEAAAAAAAAQQQSQPPPGPQNPHMSQVPPAQGYYGGAGFNPLDPRASIAKPPVAYSTTGSTMYPDQTVSSVPSSPPHSPTPAYHPYGTPSPPPPGGQVGQQPGYDQQQQQFGNVSPGPVNGGPGAGYQQQQPQHGYGTGGYTQHTAELPAQRGDGELRELQG